MIEAKRVGIIPEDYWNVFPDKCVHCGEDLDITENRTILVCPNPYCFNKSNLRLAEMLQNFGVKGIGESYCEMLLDSMERYKEIRRRENNFHPILDAIQVDYVSPLEVFFLPMQYYPDKFNYLVTKERYKSIQNVLEKEYSFAEVVKNLGLPGLGIKSLKSFGDCSSAKDLAKKTSGFKNLRDFLIGKFGYCDTAYAITETVQTYAREFFLLDKIFNYSPIAKRTISISVTGSIFLLGSFTREEFVDYINSHYKGEVSVVVSKALESVEFIIADSPSNSKTYQAGLRRNNLENKKVLVTSVEFKEAIDRRLNPDG